MKKIFPCAMAVALVLVTQMNEVLAQVRPAGRGLVEVAIMDTLPYPDALAVVVRGPSKPDVIVMSEANPGATVLAAALHVLMVTRSQEPEADQEQVIRVRTTELAGLVPPEIHMEAHLAIARMARAQWRHVPALKDVGGGRADRPARATQLSLPPGRGRSGG